MLIRGTQEVDGCPSGSRNTSILMEVLFLWFSLLRFRFGTPLFVVLGDDDGGDGPDGGGCDDDEDDAYDDDDGDDDDNDEDDVDDDGV